MRDYWQEFLEWLSEEELIRFTRRAQLAGKPELAEQFEAKLAKRACEEALYLRQDSLTSIEPAS